jgi:putative transposase
MACLAKDRDAMLTFYDYPAENRQHIRTSHPIESVFATVRLRATKTKHCGSRTTTLAMAFKLMATAQKKWLRLRGYHRLAEVITGVKFVNGIKQTGDQQQEAA